MVKDIFIYSKRSLISQDGPKTWYSYGQSGRVQTNHEKLAINSSGTNDYLSQQEYFSLAFLA
jgi:hypothetical protein